MDPENLTCHTSRKSFLKPFKRIINFLDANPKYVVTFLVFTILLCQISMTFLSVEKVRDLVMLFHNMTKVLSVNSNSNSNSYRYEYDYQMVARTEYPFNVSTNKN